ncbi:MAG: hypothetical protein EBS04_08640, partial [Chitinophagia bacterium]|nr:hypothetical protein [Chitinophagia bacterium]
MVRVAHLRRFTFDLIFSVFLGTQIFRLLMGGWSTLNPHNYQWISGDNTSGYIAQLFFASDRWRFPIASNPKFGLELSTSLIYSGPPLPIALTQKLLRIDPELQFIGIWLLLMIVLQIIFGILIARELGYTILASRFAGLLFVTPFFLYRFQVHFWLTAHFLILWAFWITIRSISRSRYCTLEISGLIVIAYSINSYILVMTLIVLSYPTILAITRSKKLTSSTLKHILMVTLSIVACYFIFDFRSQKGTFFENLRMNFTGQYTEIPANLLALINPEVGYERDCSQGHCIFGSGPIPNYFIKNFSILNFDLGGVQGNYDAFLYLGMGILFLSLVAIYMIFATRNSKSIFKIFRSHRLVIIYLFLISAYAITYKVSVGSHQLDLGDPKLLRWALSMFRASGRFMWIVAYFLIILL